MALMQVSVCCGTAGEEGAEKDVLWNLKSSEVGKIYKKSYMLNL